MITFSSIKSVITKTFLSKQKSSEVELTAVNNMVLLLLRKNNRSGKNYNSQWEIKYLFELEDVQQKVFHVRITPQYCPSTYTARKLWYSVRMDYTKSPHRLVSTPAGTAAGMVFSQTVLVCSTHCLAVLDLICKSIKSCNFAFKSVTKYAWGTSQWLFKLHVICKISLFQSLTVIRLMFLPVV